MAENSKKYYKNPFHHYSTNTHLKDIKLIIQSTAKNTPEKYDIKLTQMFTC